LVGKKEWGKKRGERRKREPNEKKGLAKEKNLVKKYRVRGRRKI